MRKLIKQYDLVRIRQIAIWISVTETSCRSESSNVSLVVSDKLIFVKKKSIIDGAVKVESLLITDNINSKVVSFFKESSRLKRLHINGTDFITNCKGWKNFLSCSFMLNVIILVL